MYWDIRWNDSSFRMMWSWKLGCQTKSHWIFRDSKVVLPLYHRMIFDKLSCNIGFLLPVIPPGFPLRSWGRGANNRVSTAVRPSSGLSTTKMPCTWLGITIWSANLTNGKYTGIANQQFRAIRPISFKTILSSTARPKKQIRSFVHMVIKYAASHP